MYKCISPCLKVSLLQGPRHVDALTVSVLLKARGQITIEVTSFTGINNSHFLQSNCKEKFQQSALCVSLCLSLYVCGFLCFYVRIFVSRLSVLLFAGCNYPLFKRVRCRFGIKQCSALQSFGGSGGLMAPVSCQIVAHKYHHHH